MTQRGSILLVDDRPEDAEFVCLLLTKSPHCQFSVEHVQGLREGIAMIHQRQFDVVLIDVSVCGSDGPEAIQRLKEVAPELPLVVLTNVDDEELALNAIRCGAQEYLCKEHLMGHLLTRVIRHSIARQQQLQEAQNQALTHALTGIGNRRAFDMELTRRISDFRRYNTGCCVMLADIDHFKSINDRYGHDQGDEVLRRVSRRLRHTLRQTDVIARYGGEEFGIILPVTPVQSALDIAERVRQSIAQDEWSIDGESAGVTVSIGLADVSDEDDESKLLRRVDEFMYKAKKRGRNRCCWHDGILPQHGQAVDTSV